MNYRFPAFVLLAALAVGFGVLWVIYGGDAAAGGNGSGFRPLLHACLNGGSALAILVGFLFIRGGRKGLHIASMIVAGLLTLTFLASYLDYHYQVGSTPFTGQGPIRIVYFAILLSHTVLAAVVAPLAASVYYLAIRARFKRHKKLARWTLPLWLYTSVTGVLVYLMLHVWFPAP